MRADQRASSADEDLGNAGVGARTAQHSLTWQVSPDLLGALNSQGYFETSNPAWMTVLGWSEAEVATMSIFEMLHPDDVERTRKGFELTQQGQPAIRFPNRYRCKDGTYRWISWVGVPEDGMVYCSGRDITAEVEQAEQLAATRRERDSAWVVSQDLLVTRQAGAPQSPRGPRNERIPPRAHQCLSIDVNARALAFKCSDIRNSIDLGVIDAATLSLYAATSVAA